MKKRILVVDDEPALTRMVKLNLEQTGDYEVRTENQGGAALEAALLAADGSVRLDMVGVKAVRAFDGWVVVTRLNGGVDGEVHQLLGAAPCETEAELVQAAVQAVLDASNRVMERALAAD